MHFEEAQKIKEKIDVLENYQSRSTIINPKITNIDVFSIVSDEAMAYVNFLQISHGAIVRSHTMEIKKKLEETDEEILDFLMTSEFENEYKDEEFKYLLFKWRYFYRLLHGKVDLIKTDKNFEIEGLKSEIERLKTLNNEILTKNAKQEDEILMLKNRKLTLRERLSGKIIQKNENK